MELEELASDRSSWHSLCKDNMLEFESSCMSANAYLTQNLGPGLGGFWCDTCGRLYASLINELICDERSVSSIAQSMNMMDYTKDKGGIKCGAKR